jgi:hypothetical protein
MRGNFIAKINALWAIAANAEEVLYCVDTDQTGFAWRNGQAKHGRFKTDRYTVKVVSETERVITRMEGDTAGGSFRYLCKPETGDVIVCADRRHMYPWVFKGMAYTYAFLAGGPTGNDPNIFVAYGICTKF